MSALGSLVVKLGLEYAQFTEGLDKNEQAALASAKKLQDTYDKMVQAVEGRFSSLQESLTKAVAGAVSVAGLMTVFGKIREETINSQKEQAQLAAALRSTGEAAGYSQEQLNDMAAALSKTTAYSAGEINQAQARLLSYTNIVGEQFPRALRAAMDMGTRLGMDLNSSMETVAKAIDKPSAGMQALQRQGFKFTEAQVEMAKALENSGRLADAQSIVFKELETSYGGAAEAARNTLGGALTAVGNTINDLLTADDASVPALRQSIEDFNALLQSESTRSAFSFYVELMVDTANAAVGLGIALAELRSGGLGGLLGAATSGNASGELVDIEGKLAKLRADATALDPSAGLRNKVNEFVFGDFGDLQRQIGVLENQREVLLRNVSAADGLGDSYESLVDGNESLVAALSGTTQALQVQGAAVGLTDSFLKKYGTTAQKAALEIAEWKAKLGDAFTPEMEAKIRATYAKMGKAASEARSPVLALIDGIEKRTALLSLELSSEEKLTEGEKAAIDVLEQLRSGKVKVTEAESALIGERLKSMLDQEKAIKRTAEEKQALEAVRVERVKVVQGMEQSAAAVLQSNEELEREIELIGLTQAQQIDVMRARNDAIILTKEATLAELERRDAITGTMSREQIALAQEIDGLKRRNELLGKKQAREEEFTAWQSMWQSIDQTAHDVFVNVFEDGAGTFKRLGQTLKAAVLDLLYQMTIKRWIISIGASVSGMGTAAAASAGGGVLSTMGSAGGILSGVGAMGGAFAGGMGWLTGATTLGGALGAGGSLITAGGAGLLPGMGMIAGALAPIALGLAGLVSLFGGMDRSGTPHWGAAAEYDGTTLTGGDAVFRRSGTAGRYSGQAQAGVDAVARSVGDTLNTLSRIFGGSGGYDVMTAYSDDSSDDPGFGSLRVRRGGQNVLDWENGRTSKWAPKIFADGEEGWKMYLSAVAKDVRDVFLSPDMGAPSWARSMLQSLDDSVTMDQLAAVVQQIGEIQTLFVNLGDTLVGFADMTDLAFEALLRASGGAQALAANADAFYQNFYSDDERKAIAKRQLGEKLKELGVDIDLDDPQAREKYRALVEQKLAQANTEEASKAALKEQLSDSVLSNMFAGGGIEGLVGLDIAGLPPGLLGNDGVATQEQIDKINAGIAALDTAGMSLDDLKGSVADLLEPIVGTGKGAAETAAALLGLSGTFASVTDSAQDAEAAAKAQEKSRLDANRAATDAALQALERAAAAERTAIQARVTAAQERVAQERAIVELTQGHVRELRGQVDTTAAMAVAQARRFIDDAVAAAGNSGYLLDQAELSRAIDTVRGGMGQDAYSSRLAWEEAQLKMALQLETLGDSAKEQLTTDEQTLAAAEEQLRYLDDMLTAARVEIDAIRGTTKAVESVTAAIDSLSAAILKEKEDGEGKGEGKGGGGEGGGKFAIGGSGPGESAGGSGGGHIETEEEEIRRYYKGIDISDAQSMRNARNTALFMGWTQEDIARAYDVDVEDLRKLFDDFGIPAFARGGTHAGGLRLVGEEGPELEVTGAARIYSAGQTRDMLSQLSGGGASAEMARAVERLALAVEGQGTRLGDIGQHTRDTADVLMRVTRGGQAMQNANASKTLELRV